MKKPLSSVFLAIVIMLAFIAMVAAMLLAPYWRFSNLVFGRHTIYIHHNTPVRVDLADSDTKRQIGLSNKNIMAAGEGMLFIFDRDKRWRVWMKNMNFGLDIIWLDKNGKIVDIREFVYPDSYPSVFEPNYEARYILEVIAGYTSAVGLRRGDVIDLNLQ